MAATAPFSLLLSQKERSELERIARGQALQARFVQRAKMVLGATQGQGPVALAKHLGCHRKTVSRSLVRFQTLRQQSPDAPLLHWLRDAPRLGRPDTYDECFWVDLIAVATQEPKECGRPITHWTCHELADEMIRQKRATRLVASTVSRFLSTCQLKPHQVKEWMNRPNDPEFESRCEKLKALLAEAVKQPSLSLKSVPLLPERERVVVSFDEKTGMQAKERIAPEQGMKPGQPCRQEFEYARHGTLVLFAMMLVHNGVMMGEMRERRRSEETAEVLSGMLYGLKLAGYKKIEVVLDQLNTHYSLELVRQVAHLCGEEMPAAKQLETGKQRREWLEREDKRIVFHFTPKHASWLNPVEIWFGVLVRKVLRRGSFSSKEELRARVEQFIRYYNRKLAHPYRLKPYKKVAA